MGFGVRAGTLAEWAGQFGFTQTDLGTITGGGLTGFGIVILLASLITDRVGYKAILLAAFLLHVLSVIITLMATPVFAASGQDAAYWCLFIGVFIFAIANGLCEAVINLYAQFGPNVFEAISLGRYNPNILAYLGDLYQQTSIFQHPKLQISAGK